MSHAALHATMFWIVTLVGGGLMLGGMTSLSVEGCPQGSLLMTVMMAALFLFGVGGLLGVLS